MPDKHSTRILLSCIFCTVIVFLLFLVAIRFNQLTCELVRIEPIHLRSAQLADFAERKPLRSHDKTMLMKISAYLEYNVISSINGGLGPTTKTYNNNNSALANDNNQQQQLQQSATGPPINGSSQLQHQPPQPSSPISISTNNRSAPTPSVPQLNLLQPVASQDASSTNNNNIIKSSTGTVQQQQQQLIRDDQRFLPLDLEEIQTRKMDDNDKFKYSLTFNCSTLNMVFVRQQQRVYIESMSLELEPQSQRKSTCVVLLPLQPYAVFQMDTQDGLAHYHCKSPMTFNCYYYPSPKPIVPPHNKNSTITPQFVANNYNLNALSLAAGGQLIAELHINAIEFETTTLNSTEKVKHDTFKRKPKDCEPQPISGQIMAQI